MRWFKDSVALKKRFAVVLIVSFYGSYGFLCKMNIFCIIDVGEADPWAIISKFKWFVKSGW